MQLPSPFAAYGGPLVGLDGRRSTSNDYSTGGENADGRSQINVWSVLEFVMIGLYGYVRVWRGGREFQQSLVFANCYSG